MKNQKKISFVTGYKKLILKLKPSQDKAAIGERLRDLNLILDKIEKEEEGGVYSLVFPNSDMARDAFDHAEDLGYEFQRVWPERPKPTRPIKYISLKKLKIRDGKSLKGEVVGSLPAHEIVTVNQIKNRRARLINVINGKVTITGWVSLSTNNGETLLAQVCDIRMTPSEPTR